MTASLRKIDDDVGAHIEVVKDLVRKKSLKTFETSSRLKNCKVEDLPPDQPVYAHSLSVIMILGNAIRMVPKIHFTTLNAQKALANRREKDISEVEQRLAEDFIRELSNLMAGTIKTSLIEVGVITGISLPLVTRGFDELIFSDKIEKGEECDSWKIGWDDGHIICSSTIKIDEPESFKSISFSEESQPEDDGDGEFL